MKKIIFTTIALVGLAFVSQAQNNDPKSEVGKREKRQNERINQGVKSGELTKGEAKQLRGEEKGIRDQVKDERAANGGKLTKGERKQANKELNHESKKIHREKHQ